MYIFVIILPSILIYTAYKLNIMNCILNQSLSTDIDYKVYNEQYVEYDNNIIKYDKLRQRVIENKKKVLNDIKNIDNNYNIL